MIGSAYPLAAPLDGTEVLNLFQAGHLRTTAANSLAALARANLGSTDHTSGQMYADQGAAVARFADRLLAGAAADNQALANRDATPNDWLSTILGGTSIGAWPVWGAQGASMARFGSIGWLGASRTSDAASATPTLGYVPASIGVASFAVNDDTASPTTTTATAFYGHSIRMAGVSYQPTFGAELEVENRGTLPSGTSNPYHVNVGGGTYGLQIGAGGGQTSGTADASAVLTVVSNPNAFQRGIVFGATALTGTTGTALDTGYGAAMAMSRNQGVEWWAPDGAVAALIRSTVTQHGFGGRMEFQDSGVVFTNANGQGLFAISTASGATPYNTLLLEAGNTLSSAAGIYAAPSSGGNGAGCQPVECQQQQWQQRRQRQHRPASRLRRPARDHLAAHPLRVHARHSERRVSANHHKRRGGQDPCLHARAGGRLTMDYLVPAQLVSRLAEFLEDHPSPTSARLKADMLRLVRPADPASAAPAVD